MKYIPTPYISSLTLARQNHLRILAGGRVRHALEQRKNELAASSATASRLRAKLAPKTTVFTEAEKSSLLFPFVPKRAVRAIVVPEQRPHLFSFLQ